MSILDDAIREHLELKRAHGADESELKRLEDEAFGPPGRPEEPDPFAEAPTEFLAAPGGARRGAEAEAEPAERRINIADLQEAPGRRRRRRAGRGEASRRRRSPPPPSTRRSQRRARVRPDAKVEQAAAEHERRHRPTTPTPAPTTEERHAIADQPTELFDVEADLVPGAASSRARPTSSCSTPRPSEPRLAPSSRPTRLESTGPECRDRRQTRSTDEDDDDSGASSASPTSSTRRSRRRSPTSTRRCRSRPSDEHATFPATDEHEAVPHTDEHEAVPHTDEHELSRPDADALPEPPSEEHTASTTTASSAARGRGGRRGPRSASEPRR